MERQDARTIPFVSLDTAGAASSAPADVAPDVVEFPPAAVPEAGTPDAIQPMVVGSEFVEAAVQPVAEPVRQKPFLNAKVKAYGFLLGVATGVHLNEPSVHAQHAADRLAEAHGFGRVVAEIGAHPVMAGMLAVRAASSVKGGVAAGHMMMGPHIETMASVTHATPTGTPGATPPAHNVPHTPHTPHTPGHNHGHYTDATKSDLHDAHRKWLPENPDQKTLVIDRVKHGASRIKVFMGHFKGKQLDLEVTGKNGKAVEVALTEGGKNGKGSMYEAEVGRSPLAKTLIDHAYDRAEVVEGNSSKLTGKGDQLRVTSTAFGSDTRNANEYVAPATGNGSGNTPVTGSGNGGVSHGHNQNPNPSSSPTPSNSPSPSPSPSTTHAGPGFGRVPYPPEMGNGATGTPHAGQDIYIQNLGIDPGTHRDVIAVLDQGGLVDFGLPKGFDPTAVGANLHAFGIHDGTTQFSAPATEFSSLNAQHNVLTAAQQHAFNAELNRVGLELKDDGLNKAKNGEYYEIDRVSKPLVPANNSTELTGLVAPTGNPEEIPGTFGEGGGIIAALGLTYYLVNRGLKKRNEKKIKAKQHGGTTHLLAATSEIASSSEGRWAGSDDGGSDGDD